MSMESTIISKIKRLNERVTDIARKVAQNILPKSALDNMRRAMETLAGQENITKSGNISHGKKAVAAIDEGELDALLRKPTAGELKERVKAGAQLEYQHEPNPFEMQEYIENVEGAYKALDSAPQETYDAYDHKFRGRTGKPTYGELKQAREEWKAMTPEAQQAYKESVSDVNKIFR